MSVFRVIDDTLGEIGIPGPFDVLPSPSELIHAFGVPTPDDLGESLKAKISSQITERNGRIFG